MSLAGMGFDSKCNFTPPTILLPSREFDFGGQWDLITALTQDQGNRLLEGTNKALCTPAARRKEQCPHRRLSQTCLQVSRSLWQRCGSTVACCRIRGTEYNSACTSPFEGGCHYLHYPYHSLASVKQQGRNTGRPIKRKLE